MLSLASSPERIPLADDPYGSAERARGYDLMVARDSLLYPMERVVSLLGPQSHAGITTANLGSETGILALMYGARCPQVHIIGLEPSTAFLQVAEENLTLARLAGFRARLEFRKSSFLSLPLEDHGVDILFTNNQLYRCDDIVGLLRECRRLVKPDGLVMLYELVRDADPQKLRFVSQWLRDGQKEFWRTVNACYTTAEISAALVSAGLEGWRMYREQLAVCIASKPVTGAVL